MQKQAPTKGRLLTMALFVLSCVGLLLFLWLSFGGSIPFEPQGYRIQIAFPQATLLAEQADVRVAGVTIGKVVGLRLDAPQNRELATLQIGAQYAPLHTDARAIIREKTVLGETYVSLTLGTPGTPTIPDGGRLANTQVQTNVYFDDLLQAFDAPTRRAFREFQQDLAGGSAGYGTDLSDALGNLPVTVATADDVLNVLNAQSAAVSQLVRNSGVVFGALDQNTAQLHNVVVNLDTVLRTTAAEQNAIAQTFLIFPTFLTQTKLTLADLQSFSANAQPLVSDLQPVSVNLRPTLIDLREFAPDLRSTFQHLNPLITESATGLPATTQILSGATPLLGALDPFLEQLNPVLEFLEIYQHQTADFISEGAGALAATTPTGTSEPGHYLRQFVPIGLESLAIYTSRPSFDRGNTYLGPTALAGPQDFQNDISPETDCNNAGGERAPVDSPIPFAGIPGCTVQTPLTFQGVTNTFPHVGPDDYSP